jgi:hypothetical protein
MSPVQAIAAMGATRAAARIDENLFIIISLFLFIFI